MSSYKICTFCGEYEHDCKCDAAKAITTLRNENDALKVELASANTMLATARHDANQQKNYSDTLKAALEKCAKALDEISTHLDPIDAALRKTQVSAFSEDDESYWIHEINSHNANAKLINTALSNPTVQAALRGIKPPNHPIE